MSNLNMRFKILLGVFIFIVILSGCANNTEINEEIFQVGIDEIKNVKVNEVFEIYGYLRNNSERKVDIFHGSGMFRYEVYDEDGNRILPNSTILYRDDVGFSVKIKSDESYRNNGEGFRSKEFYQFLIQKPGIYKVKTIVEFSVMNDENKSLINLSSDFKQFSVE